MARGALDVFLADLPVVQVFVHQFQVEVRQALHHFATQFLGLAQQRVRNGRDDHFHFLVGDGLHLDQVDDPGKILLAADGQLVDQGVGAQHLVHHLHGLEQVAAGAVH
ncbi:MAG: hypothetical protein MUF02_06200, partial [Acidobacteria bacterium]|nr:hypothetical protein [Acidobacteriota bacterium]